MDDALDGEYQDTSQIDLMHLPLISWGEDHGLRDVLWRERVSGYSRDPLGPNASAAGYYRAIGVPALHFGGWYDSFTRGTLAIWNGIRTTSSNPAARGQQWLVMGPWDHDGMSLHLSGTPPPTNIGNRDIGDKALTTYGDTLIAFFDFYLKGEANGFDERPPVSYFNIGDNDWRHVRAWPPEGSVERVLYLRSGGALSESRPGDEAPQRFDYDPRNPVTITADTDVWGRAAGLRDRQVLLEREDVLTFDSVPLRDDLDITGPVSLELFASSSARDTDFTAALVDVAPDGYSLLIQEGILRASFRTRDQLPSLIEPGEVYRFDIDLWATSYTVPAGHKLRVEVSSSNFPRFARNLNNGEPFGTSDRIEVATQTILHSVEYPSRLVMSVIEQR